MKDIEKLIPFEKYTSFMKLARVYENVIKYVSLLKSKIDKYKINREQVLNFYSFTKISTEILREEQKAHFSDVIEYIDGNRRTKSMPNLMGQLNIFKSKDGLLRVRSKFRNWTENATSSFQILLPRTGFA